MEYLTAFQPDLQAEAEGYAENISSRFSSGYHL